MQWYILLPFFLMSWHQRFFVTKQKIEIVFSATILAKYFNFGSSILPHIFFQTVSFIINGHDLLRFSHSSTEEKSSIHL